MALARVEPRRGEDWTWAERQRIATALRALSYQVDLWGAGDDWVLLLS